jgi:hypothetical protein
MSISRDTWITKDEKKFINEMLRNKPKIKRIEALNNYIQGCLLREKWGDINRNEIIDYITQKLTIINGKGK